MVDRISLASTATLPRLGRYELLAGIASGGMGSVILARLAGVGGFQRLFAIKVLHKQYWQDAEFLEMLLDEARIAARIHHPNAVSIQEIGQDPTQGYYLVMDYIEGFPLSDMLVPFAHMPWGARWRIVNRVMLDVLYGLHAAHTLADDDGQPLNVVHRDVSPQNILVSVDGVARVTDFGIAKAAGRLAQTRVGSVKGKLAYMAPEQARGQSLDGRVDLFAAGIVWWEAMTGQRLFKGNSESDTFARILNARVPFVSEVVPTAPEGIDRFGVQALERQVDRRFANGREMASALERAARAYDLVADAAEVGEWMGQVFAAKLEERRTAIRQAAKNTVIVGEVQMLAPGNEVSGTANAGSSATDDDELDRLPTTHMDTSNASAELRAAIDAYKSGKANYDAPAADAFSEVGMNTEPIPLSRPAPVAPTPYAPGAPAGGSPAGAWNMAQSGQDYARPFAATHALTPPPAPTRRRVGRVVLGIALALCAAVAAVIAGAGLARWFGQHRQ